MRNKFIVAIVFVAALAGVGYKIYSARNVVNNTGLLKITSTDPGASLAISQANSWPVYIGQGNADIRIDQGTYLVSASTSGTIVTATSNVSVGQTSNVNLDIAAKVAKGKYYSKLTSQLPYLGPAFTYKIDYYMQYSNGQGTPVITISAVSDDAYQQALNWLRSIGINPSNFEIKATKTQLVPSNYNYFNSGGN